MMICWVRFPVGTGSDLQQCLDLDPEPQSRLRNLLPLKPEMFLDLGPHPRQRLDSDPSQDLNPSPGPDQEQDPGRETDPDQ